MFDFHSFMATEYVPYTKNVNITEVKAPTDASINLYGEIKEKAYKSILDSIVVNDNIFNSKSIMYKDWASYQEILKYSFTLNGKEYTGEYPHNIDNIDNPYAKIKGIYKSLSDQIAGQILGPLVQYYSK